MKNVCIHLGPEAKGFTIPWPLLPFIFPFMPVSIPLGVVLAMLAEDSFATLPHPIHGTVMFHLKD